MLKKKVEINKLQNKQIFCKQLCAGIQWCRLISHIFPLLIMSMFYLYSPENLRKSTFWSFQGLYKKKYGPKWIKPF